MSDPTDIGPYRVIRRLGTGGMGTVYLARRADDSYEAEVALKVLKPEHVATDLSRRFHRERQILAELGHPGIARLLGGGETEEGLPYLVVELVDGVPIDRYCEERGIGVAARIALFREVCEAVQYAHARLVVHTDIKPENVLVDAEGRTRLLDFGIAKLLGDRPGAAQTADTTLRPMTPAFASPEQILGRPVATSTDVYSLGVLLYVLLTGRLPYPADAPSGRPLEDAVLRHEPVRPSAAGRVDPGNVRPSRATALRVDVDLDTIVLKSLQKDPARRYESVQQLSDDLERYLDGRPVRARPDTWTYRASKFVRRHRGSVGGAATSAVSLALFGVVSLVQAAQLQRETGAAEAARTEAEAVTDFLVDVFDATDPNGSQGLDLTARDILGRGTTRIREELADQPAVQGAVALAIGDAYFSLAAYDSATATLAFAVERTADARGPRSVEYAQALGRLGQSRRVQGALDEAEAHYRESLDILTESLGPDAIETAVAWNDLGNLLSDRNEEAEAEAAHLEALRIRQPLGDTHPATLTTLNNLGTLYNEMGRYDEAIDFSRRAAEARRILHPEPHLNHATSLNNLASALERAGRYEEAEPLYRQSLEIRRTLLDEHHPMVLTALNNLGTLYIRSGRSEAAIPLLEDVIASHRASDGPPMRLAGSLSNYATALLRVGRNAEAIEPLLESEEMLTRVLGPVNPTLAFPRQSLADAYHGLGRPAEAERYYRLALEVRTGALDADHPDVAFTKAKLGTFLLEVGRIDEAAPLLDEALAVRNAVLAPDHPNRLDSLLKSGRLRIAQGRIGEGRALLEEAIELGEAARGPDDGVARAAREALEEIG